ncbi:ADP-dependent glucokinase [Elysia marginata]|uniref:ADP-dependent glucokinase n=1 Tax=Elysia marginata TaxID=1093978 RepID=A0AAV4J1A6_9GAST|nr:ADP-dependent glucokinase [Elysia marginata]
MFSGTVKIGASISVCVLIAAYFYQRHADEVLQERLRDVLSGLLRAEKKIPIESKRVAVGFGACEDIFTNGLALLNALNLTSPSEAVHQNFVNTPEELAQLFAFFFQSGAAAERYVANASLFEAMVKAGTKFKDHQWALGGNAAVMARRLAMEGFDVLLGARMGDTALKTIPDSVKVIGNTIARSDIHLIMEYKTNDRWGQFTSPRANRLILHNDRVNPFLDGMEEFLDRVLTFKPSLLVIGGLQMMDNFPDDQGIRFARLEKLSTFLQTLPRSTLVHFEMASFTEISLLTEIIERVIYYCDSLGANEQELPNILQVVQGKNVTLVSDQRPRVATVLDQMRKLYSLLGSTPEYKTFDVYNADETGLFWRLLRNKTTDFKGQECHGGKDPKDRITLLTCANMDGSHKLPLFVTGKFKTLRCFKGVRKLPVQCQANSKAWMTAGIFTEWLREFDKMMYRQKRKVLLTLDNCTAHPKVDNLKAVELLFLLPNTTSKSQPCDMGIINNLKFHYRGTLLKRIINHVDEGNGFDNFKLTLLDAVIILKQAWEKVEPATIRNCFKKAGFQASETERENEIEAEDTDVQPFLSRLLVEYGIPDSLDDLKNLDQDVPTAPSPSEEMNPSTTDSERENQTEQAADNEDDQGEEMPPVASAMETLS